MPEGFISWISEEFSDAVYMTLIKPKSLICQFVFPMYLSGDMDCHSDIYSECDVHSDSRHAPYNYAVEYRCWIPRDINSVFLIGPVGRARVWPALARTIKM